MDDHALDAPFKRLSGDEPQGKLRRDRSGGRRALYSCGGARSRSVRALQHRLRQKGKRIRVCGIRAALSLCRRKIPGKGLVRRECGLRHADGRDGHRAQCARVRRGRRAGGKSLWTAFRQICGRPRPHDGGDGRLRRSLCQGGGRGDHQGSDRAGQALQSDGVYAQLSLLLAVRYAAHLLCARFLVHQNDGGKGAAPRLQRVRQLDSRFHQARQNGKLSGKRDRLGAFPRAVLGDAPSRLGMRQVRKDARDGKQGGAEGKMRRGRGYRTPSPVHRRPDVLLRMRRHVPPRERGDRLLVRLRLHALRAVPLSV